MSPVTSSSTLLYQQPFTNRPVIGPEINPEIRKQCQQNQIKTDSHLLKKRQSSRSNWFARLFESQERWTRHFDITCARAKTRARRSSRTTCSSQASSCFSARALENLSFCHALRSICPARNCLAALAAFRLELPHNISNIFCKSTCTNPCM